MTILRHVRHKVKRIRVQFHSRILLLGILIFLQGCSSFFTQEKCEQLPVDSYYNRIKRENFNFKKTYENYKEFVSDFDDAVRLLLVKEGFVEEDFFLECLLEWKLWSIQLVDPEKDIFIVRYYPPRQGTGIRSFVDVEFVMRKNETRIVRLITPGATFAGFAQDSNGNVTYPVSPEWNNYEFEISTYIKSPFDDNSIIQETYEGKKIGNKTLPKPNTHE